MTIATLYSDLATYLWGMITTCKSISSFLFFGQPFGANSLVEGAHSSNPYASGQRPDNVSVASSKIWTSSICHV